MTRYLAVLYGAFAYAIFVAIFLATILCAIGLVGNFEPTGLRSAI
jgi:hypothetical protein